MTKKDRMRRIHSDRVLKAIEESNNDVDDIYGARESEESKLLDLLGYSKAEEKVESEVSTSTIIIISTILFLILGGVLVFLVYNL